MIPTMSELRPRVTGTEMEWAVGLRHLGDEDYTQATKSELDKAVKKLQKNVGAAGNSMLRNGGRCYRDIDCLEYCTGEDDSFMGTVANEIAGEQLVDEALAEYAAETDDIETYSLLKRSHYNTEGTTDGLTTGYHINLCADAETVQQSEHSLYRLGLLVATESMFTGAGTLYQRSVYREAHPTIAQKTLGVASDFATSSYDKPVISIRNRSYADDAKFNRVQIVSHDPNISPWASWMALGTASLCLRTIEQKRRGKDMHLESWYRNDAPLARLAVKVAMNPNLDTTVELYDGSTISAFEIQEELLKQAQATDHTDEEARVLVEWERALKDIRIDPKLMIDRTGWVVRHEKIAKYAKRHNLPMNHADILSLDRKWDAIGEKSIATTLRNSIWSKHMPDEVLITERRNEPCPGTRAVLRAAAVEESKQHKEARIEWGWYQFGPSSSHRVEMNDPLMTSLENI
jgi:hypothetical protein